MTLFFGVAVGFVAALVAAALLSRRLLAMTMPKGPAGEGRRTILKGAIAGAVIGFGPALLLGTVVGATLGGAYGSAFAGGARESGALLGVAVGVFAVATILLCLFVGLGAWLGRLLAR